MNIVERIENLHHKVKNRKGHSFLYVDFEELLKILGANKALLRDETIALDDLVGTLLFEADTYSKGFPYPYYPYWSLRCLDCATLLMDYIPDDFPSKSWSNNKRSELCRRFISEPIMTYFVRTETYKRYKTGVIDGDSVMLWKTASECFYLSDEGGRPKGAEVEYGLHKAMTEGYELANKYLGVSSDYSHFSDWFSHMSPVRTERLLESASAFAQKSPSWHNDDLWKIVSYLEDTLEKQFSLLWKWLDGDIKGFVDFWGAPRIEDILEIVDDATFYRVLRKIHTLKNNAVVADVLRFYADDDERQIREFVRGLLADK